MPDDWVLFNTKSVLGGALAGQKKFQEAEPLLVEGYSGMKEREAKIPPAAKTRLAEAIQRLIDLYTAWDRPEEAEKMAIGVGGDRERGQEALAKCEQWPCRRPHCSAKMLKYA